MTVKIRLARYGRKGKPFYRVVVANSTAPRNGKFLENVGTYNPLLTKENENRFSLNEERIEYWLSVGAVPTDKVAKFLNELKVKGAEKYKVDYSTKPQKEKKKKEGTA